MLINTYRSRDETQEHVQKLVHVTGGHEMICADQSCSGNALGYIIFERKWWSRSNLNVAHEC
jgi:hypothetical protein